MPQRVLIALVTMLMAMPLYADDRRSHSVKLKATGGKLEFEVPESWGSKPDVKQGDAATLIGFTPAGTRRNPIFQVSMLVGIPEEPVSAESVRRIAEGLRDEFRETALEEEVLVSDVDGAANMISYFTLTDKEIKPREYQYLTAAVVSDGTMMLTCYFFSNDGAPDYAADAMHLMETARYLPKEQKKKR